MLKMDNVLEQAPSAFNQIDLPGYFSKLGVDTHVIVPAAFPESQFPTTFQKFSIGTTSWSFRQSAATSCTIHPPGK